jgi:hypothetical protein
VASCNRLLRHYLAYFRRRTKCYSQCKQMLLQAVLLLRAKKNPCHAALAMPYFQVTSAFVRT